MLGAERLPVLRHPHDVLVLGDDPEAAVLLAVGDGADAAHGGEGLVELVGELGRQVVEAVGAPRRGEDVASGCPCLHCILLLGRLAPVLTKSVSDHSLL